MIAGPDTNGSKARQNSQKKEEKKIHRGVNSII